MDCLLIIAIDSGQLDKGFHSKNPQVKDWKLGNRLFSTLKFRIRSFKFNILSSNYINNNLSHWNKCYGKKLIIYSIHIHLNSESLEATLWQTALIQNYVKKWCAGELMSQKNTKKKV